MSAARTALVVGGTGRTGRRVLQQLLDRGVSVRAVVRSADRLSKDTARDPRLEVIVADLLSLGDETLLGHVRGCDAVISCLGHVLSVRGIFGPPRHLVTVATTRLCRAIEAARPTSPVKFILMSSVSVNQPAGRDTRRGVFERGLVRALRWALPPADDNQAAADFLCDRVGTDSPFIQWVVVRPDTLREGGVSEYALHEGLVNSLFRPGSTNMANVAHLMCELVNDDEAWRRWRGKLPVIVNTDVSRATIPGAGRSCGRSREDSAGRRRGEFDSESPVVGSGRSARTARVGASSTEGQGRHRGRSRDLPTAWT